MRLLRRNGELYRAEAQVRESMNRIGAPVVITFSDRNRDEPWVAELEADSMIHSHGPTMLSALYRLSISPIRRG